MFQFSSKFSTGFLLGFGAGFVSRDLISSGPSIVRPVLKGVMKAGIGLMEKGRETLGHLVETVEDLLAEVRGEQADKAESKEVTPAASATATGATKKAKTAIQNS